MAFLDALVKNIFFKLKQGNSQKREEKKKNPKFRDLNSISES